MMRREDKYLIQNTSFEMLDGLIHQTLRGDIHSRTYPVHSLYFDTLDYSAYWTKREGYPNRYKIRLRHYEGSHYFLEWKIKRGENSFKTRFEVQRNNLIQQIDLLWPHQLVQRPSDFFRESLEISYTRTEYTHPLSKLRLTVDQHIQYRLPIEGFSKKETYQARDLVLELKYQPQDQSFHYIKDLLNDLNLKRESLSKYTDSLDKAGIL